MTLVVIIIGIVMISLGLWFTWQEKGPSKKKKSDNALDKKGSKEQPESKLNSEPESQIYDGIIIKESLGDPSILKTLDVITHDIESFTNLDVYKVKATPEDFGPLSKALKSDQYHIYFWSGYNRVAIFKDKTFQFRVGNSASWKQVIDYGLSCGIPIYKLDFPTD